MHTTVTSTKTETSCGTLVVNANGDILLGHVPDRDYWEIPKGRQNAHESALEAAKRELQEETGLELNAAFFEEVGDFDYRPGKRLHLYKVYVADTLNNLDSLRCTSYFPCEEKDEPILAMDSFCWASREDIPKLCLQRLANRLLLLHW
jgi:putative (di)nucleoside polyphosphate hydrolase